MATKRSPCPAPCSRAGFAASHRPAPMARGVPVGDVGRRQTDARRNRSALAMTDTEDKLIAAAASIGLSSQPVSG